MLLGVLALSSCGNDAQSSPEVVPTGASTSTAAPSTAAPTTGASTNALETTPQATATASDPTSARPTTSAPTTDAPTTTGGNEGKPPTSETAPSSAEGFKLPDSLLAVKGPVLPKSDPVSLTIPAINVQSSLMDLGLNPDGTVQVPSLDDPDAEAGWYTGSPTPGQQGPSILLGHIDSRRYGPGVFYDLDKLVPGDTVEVTRADGSVATFTIDKVQSYLKSEFPTEEVYGNIDHAGIRLITCGGAFNSDEGSYESNIIAFGSLVS
ncbi:sortase [Nakamurella silvestris]|nr:sortase [Nakamurella silvestris]